MPYRLRVPLTRRAWLSVAVASTTNWVQLELGPRDWRSLSGHWAVGAGWLWS